ncbi:MAG: protein adenylyltransferase SelO [Candidatus Sericytochromatia bacterium]
MKTLSSLPTLSLPEAQLRFDNRYVRELPGDPDTSLISRPVRGISWSPVSPTPVAAPRLLASSAELAEQLGLSAADLKSEAFAQVFGGNALLPGMQPYASRYGGHQFGHWAGQLGDGRAINLGELVNAAGERWELQLKGAGPTPYSRRADGRAVLRSSLREFLCSEAMFHLGIPTTRALSLIETGDQVVRDMLYDGHPAPEPGAIVCRVAPSFLRFGHFEILTAQQEPELLARLVDFAIARDFPELGADIGPDKPDALRLRWFTEICTRTADLIAHWMRVGFVHGVMNTDNLSILGLTIDYGPYGWIDNYDPHWTPNTTDSGQKRYRFGNQPPIAHWNLACLASALAPLFADTDGLEAALDSFVDRFSAQDQALTAAKFGWTTLGERETELAGQAYPLLQASQADMTLFFRRLAEVSAAEAGDPDALFAPLAGVFYTDQAPHRDAWQDWLQRYAATLPVPAAAQAARRERMQAVNPCYVLRNYLAQEAIDLAEQGDLSRLHQLQQALRHPYTERAEFAHLAQKRPDWALNKVGCSALSCSS